MSEPGELVPDAFPVVDLSDWTLLKDEPAGREEKSGWFERGPDDPRWLFKPRVERHGRIQGEEWAEKIAAEIATLVGIPCATVELAVRDGRLGSISRRLYPAGWEWSSGAQLLSGVVPGYVPRTRDDDRRLIGGERSGHSLANIKQALRGFEPPMSSSVPSTFTAFDVFAGFMVLDALIANQDRHEENWAVVRPRTAGQPDRLAGSFDHGSSLGYGLSEADREQHVRADTIQAWAAKGKAEKFERGPDGRRINLVDHATAALGLANPGVRAYWRDRINALTSADIGAAVHRVPELSAPTRSFVGTLLDTNRRRLLDAS